MSFLFKRIKIRSINDMSNILKWSQYPYFKFGHKIDLDSQGRKRSWCWWVGIVWKEMIWKDIPGKKRYGYYVDYYDGNPIYKFSLGSFYFFLQYSEDAVETSKLYI